MYQSLGRDLAFTAKASRHRFQRVLAEAGGSLPTWITLNQLIDGHAVSQRHLAELLELEGPTVSRHLDALEAQGLVRRERNAEDRRTIRVVITPAGRRQHARLVEVAADQEALMTRGL